jgi:hypothetical protein
MEPSAESLLPSYHRPSAKLVATSKVLFFFSLAFSSVVVFSLLFNNFHQERKYFFPEEINYDDTFLPRS